jgi:sugar phosphate isomerase/epimerase
LSATAEDIKGWLEEAQKRGATHLIVACNTFDHDNYPVYVMPNQDIHWEIAQRRGQNMQTIDEVYNMSMDIEEQLNEHRAWHPDLPEKVK